MHVLSYKNECILPFWHILANEIRDVD